MTFQIKQSFFPIKKSAAADIPIFLLPYDLPLEPYRSADEPSLVIKEKKVDSNVGNSEISQKVESNLTDEQNTLRAVDKNCESVENLKII